MKLKATVPFPYAGKMLQIGESFRAVSAEDARLLKGFGKAADDIDEDDESTEEVSRQKRQYRRRDMRAEN